MSKTGRYAHFGSKQELHLATVAEAGRILGEEAARAARAGLAQLPAVCGQAAKPVADWVYEPPPVPLTPLVGRYAALEQLRTALTRPAASCQRRRCRSA
jgi:AcrR family transcriptional regulator